MKRPKTSAPEPPARPQIEDVLARRYASTPMLRIWSPEGRIVLERELWIAVMKAQRAQGLDIPAAAIGAYERVKDTVDLASIDRRSHSHQHVPRPSGRLRHGAREYR